MSPTYSDLDKDPITYLEAYCDINEIHNQNAIMSAGKKIAENPQRKLHTFSKYGYILQAFQDLLLEKKDVSTFMSLGDIASQEQLSTDSIITEGLGQVNMGIALSKKFHKSLIIFDAIIKTITAKQERDDIYARIHSVESEWMVI